MSQIEARAHRRESTTPWHGRHWVVSVVAASAIVGASAGSLPALGETATPRADARHPDHGGLTGYVDSSLIRIGTPNTVVVLRSTGLSEDTSGDMVAAEPVQQTAGTCEWRYVIPVLPAGRYTVAFTHDGPPARGAKLVPAKLQARMEVVAENGRMTAANLLAPVVLKVGLHQRYRTPSAAAAAARNGAVIEIDKGVYSGDAAVWRQHDLTLRGVGGRAHLKAEGAHAEGKAVWVIKGNNVRVENIEFSGAAVPDRNGAGIRHEGENLAVCNSYFHHNENGILGGGGRVLVEYSEFAHNGAGDGYTHNMYISQRTREFTLRYSYSHHARVGHNVKSRAARNFLLYNRIMDEVDGTSSYAVDIPEGGEAYLIGNLIQQGPRAVNHTIVSYGAEKTLTKADVFYVVNNTLVNDHALGIFISVKQGARASIMNNLFVGPGRPWQGPSEPVTNLVSMSPGIVDRMNFDYRLTAVSPARDAGVNPDNANGVDLRPVSHYVHKASSEPRPTTGKTDIGAYEYTSGAR